MLGPGFSKFDGEDRQLEILKAIPRSVSNFYREDIHSNKMAPLYYDYLETHKDVAAQHLFHVHFIYERPNGWATQLRKYTKSLSKNSFYLADILARLLTESTFGFVTAADLTEMKDVMTEVFRRHLSQPKAKAQQITDQVLSESRERNKDAKNKRK